jgi:hypothetical protein
LAQARLFDSFADANSLRMTGGSEGLESSCECVENAGAFGSAQARLFDSSPNGDSLRMTVEKMQSLRLVA